MKKRMIGLEMKKIWSVPAFSVFFLLCILFNIFLITGNDYGRDYVRYAAKVLKTTGIQMGKDFETRAGKLPESEYKDIFIAETTGKQDIFENYDTAAAADNWIGLYRMSGFVSNALCRKYQKLQTRIDELAERDASLSAGAAGMTKKLLDGLFSKLAKAVLTEGMVLAVLNALYACGCEKMQRTHFLVYSSKRGRHIQREKFAAALLSAVFAYLVLAGISFTFFAGFWEMGSIWNTDMSSLFYYVRDGLGLKIPFVSWTDFTVAGYLCAMTGMGTIVVAISAGLGFFAGLLWENVFFGFLAVVIAVAVNLQMITFAGNGGIWSLYELFQWSFAAFWWNQPVWFSEMGVSTLVPGQTCHVAAVCLLCCVFMLWAAFRYFGKKEL
ncbi:MAG: hypothetical protein NC086_08750 [Alistipes sp.]|nr:hypothetical protein [Alistipes sp.]